MALVERLPTVLHNLRLPIEQHTSSRCTVRRRSEFAKRRRPGGPMRPESHRRGLLRTAASGRCRCPTSSEVWPSPARGARRGSWRCAPGHLDRLRGRAARSRRRTSRRAWSQYVRHAPLLTLLRKDDGWDKERRTAMRVGRDKPQRADGRAAPPAWRRIRYRCRPIDEPSRPHHPLRAALSFPAGPNLEPRPQHRLLNRPGFHGASKEPGAVHDTGVGWCLTVRQPVCVVPRPAVSMAASFVVSSMRWPACGGGG